VVAFLLSTAINMAIALAIIMAFSILRTRVTWAYSPRFRQDSSQCPPLPSGLLSWVPALIRIDEDLIFKHAGLDAVVYVKFFARAFNLFIVGDGHRQLYADSQLVWGQWSGRLRVDRSVECEARLAPAGSPCGGYLFVYGVVLSLVANVVC